MANKKILVITTGGTIAMRYDEATGRLVPAVSGAELVAAVPAIAEYGIDVTVRECCNVPSGHITPDNMLALRDMIDAATGFDGYVVTHGTDTLEETAYLLDMTLATERPVCVTGAMRGASQTSPDGAGNILAAIRTAADEASAGRGVLVVLNDEIHAAALVTKTHTSSMKTFASPFWGPVGYVYFNAIRYRMTSERTVRLPVKSLDKKVALLKCYAGLDDYIIRTLVDGGYDGIVVEAFGCGNVPPAVKRGIEYARSRGVAVVITSRVVGGAVVPLYSYEGSVYSMREAGVLIAPDLPGPKARLRLQVALAADADLTQIFTGV